MATRNTQLSTLAVALGLIGVVATTGAQAVTLFSENFEGYTSFLDQAPSGDQINAGIPTILEGAAGVWYGARFEDPDGGNIDADLAVQQFGDSFGPSCTTGPNGNCTHTGRVEDDAGLLFKVNTTNMTGITLSFDWRTFSASGDKVVVGYHVGSIAGFGTCTGNGEAGCFADLRTSLPWYNTQTSTTLSGNWTQLLRANANSNWSNNQTYTLAGADNASEVWVAFWLDNGEGDYAKFDNITLTGTISNPVPEAETYAMMLAGLGLVGFMVSRRKRV
jgi:hypothetical protein